MNPNSCREREREGGRGREVQRKLKQDEECHTAAMDGLESSPGWGCVTSAPKIIVGLSLTRGIRRERASTSTVFLPPTFTLIFNATLARYCLLSLKTCFVRQHWETIPRSVSQIRFKSPVKRSKKKKHQLDEK